MKNLLDTVLFILAVFPKEISSFLCWGKPCVRESPSDPLAGRRAVTRIESLGEPITIPHNVIALNPGRRALSAVGLDSNLQYVIGFAGDTVDGEHYRLIEIMANLPQFQGTPHNVKLRIVNNVAFEASAIDQHISDQYRTLIPKSRVRPVIRDMAHGLPTFTPGISSPSSSVHASPSRSVHTNPSHGRTNPSHVHTNPSHVPATRSDASTSPTYSGAPQSSWYDQSINSAVPHLDPR